MNIRAFVTDTHPLVDYFCNNQRKLSKKAKKAFEDTITKQTTIIYVPSVVLWEVSRLLQRGKAKLNQSFTTWINQLFSYQTIVSHPLNEQTIAQCHDLQFHNDPFDQAIVATALQLDLPLITNDRKIHQHRPCKLFWD